MFYMQNLMLWASDTRKTAALRFFLSRATADCFAPLYEEDVATVVSVLAAGPRLPAQAAGRTYNLTGPAALTGIEVAMLASVAVGAQLKYADIDRNATARILAGELDPSEILLLLDLLALQSEAGCAEGMWTSSAIKDITGFRPTGLETFFVKNAASFMPAS